MQHEQSKITAMKKAERIRNGRTPDRTDVRNLNMSMMSTMSPKRKVHTSRMSMMPPPSLNTTNASRLSTMPPPASLNTTSSADLRKMQLENNNLELELMYSQYIASYAGLILEKKKLKEAEESFSKTMLSLREETRVLLEKYQALKTRLKDIQAYSDLNDYMDIIQENMNEFINKLEKHGIKDKLSHLEKALSRFNVLQCENIILPSNAEEMKEFQKTLKDCSTTLQQISDPMQADGIENVAGNYEDFMRMYTEFSGVKKIVEEKICNLQADILKTCSHLLSQSNEAG
ncbi:uncharacterized protein LOC100680311 [Nasonia vitripennis]|uniref:Uncharacterized protein n=1 Tax=Nasonia vitripennis TaxID=7425 RepID=A0A7M7QLL2_NASVI|nr:uncharacterized protein LOC100680311 [Nasonia vitripennis]XP_032455075.1 uncharacterized protein LOC100680311 [Nasonia vitripennis]